MVAVEPSPENLEVLRRNMAYNGFEFEVRPVAVAGHNGQIEITEGLHSENSIIDGTLPVECQTLDSLLAELDRIDFLKLDIEGAEPLNAPAFANVRDKIRAVLLEVGCDAREAIEYRPLWRHWRKRTTCTFTTPAGRRPRSNWMTLPSAWAANSTGGQSLDPPRSVVPLFESFPGEYAVKFDLSDIEALRQDENARVEREAALINAGVLTPEEVRAGYGFGSG